MAGDLVLNPFTELVGTGPDRFELRLPHWRRHVEADGHQIGLLDSFQEANTVDTVLTEFPFHKQRSRSFLDLCAREGVLVPIGSRGQPVLPENVSPLQTMFGSPKYSAEMPSAFAFLGVPLDFNTSGAAGTKAGPDEIRAASQPASFRTHRARQSPLGFYDYGTGRHMLEDVSIADAGDVFVAPGDDPEEVYDRITRAVIQILDAGSIPMILGGDHSISYPIIRAFPLDQLGIIHFDAHTDRGDVLPGGGLQHGNVFSVVLERLDFVEHLGQFGLRGVVSANQGLPQLKVKTLGVDQLRDGGVEAVLAALPEGLPYYVSVDIDVLDPAYAPSTGTPVPDGLNPTDLKRFMRAVGENRNIVGADIVEVGPLEGRINSAAYIASACFIALMDGIVTRARAEMGAPSEPTTP